MGFAINMDFSGIEPNTGGRSYFPVSDSNGWLCQITDSGQKENSKKDGQIAYFVLTGMEGAVQGRNHDHTVNLVNPSQKAMEIGLGELSAIGHVIGHIKPGNSSEWHNKPIRVVIVPDGDEQNPNRTKILRWHDANGNPAGKAGAGPQTQGGNFAGQTQAFGGGGQQQQQGGGQFGGGQQQQNNGGNWGGNNGGQPQGQQQQQSNTQGGFQPNTGGQQQQQGGGGFQPNGQNNGGGFQPNNTQQGGGFQPNGGQQQQQGGFQGGGQQQGGPGWGQS